MSRPDKHETMMQMAEIIAKRTTCIRRAVGAIITDESGIVLATGFNGVPQGLGHCNEGSPCTGALAKSGARLDECLAIHAEQNALIQLSDPKIAANIYTTTETCIHCTKMLLNTNIHVIYFRQDYAGSGTSLWLEAGRKVVKL